MTPQEFKAWFEGFTEAFTGVPTKAQWARVKERVGEIDGKPVTERVFVDRYWPQYIPPYPRPYWSTYSGSSVGNNTVATLCSTGGLNAMGQNLSVAGSTYNAINGLSQGMSNFNSADAMAALGRADAQALNS